MRRLPCRCPQEHIRLDIAANPVDTGNPEQGARIRGIVMKARKIDANQPEIVKGLRAIGCSVAVTSSAGDGFPDLVVGYYNKNFLLEVKDGAKSKSRQKLTHEQEQFHINWRGQITVVKTLDEAIAAVLYDR